MRCAGGRRGAEKSPPQAHPEDSSGNGGKDRQFNRPTDYMGKAAPFFDEMQVAARIGRTEDSATLRRDVEADVTANNCWMASRPT